MKTLISRFLTIPLTGLSLTTMAFFSCTRELEIVKPQPANVEAMFVVSAAARPAARSITEGGAADNEVKDITVLLFDNTTGEYRSFIRTTALQSVPTGNGNENLWKFSAKLPDGSYKALFLANAAATIDSNYDLAARTVKHGGGYMTALTMENIEWALLRVIYEKYNSDPGGAGYTPFVMSSARMDITVPFSYANQYLDHPVRLARDVAKINVRFASQEVSDRFEITEIRLCNRNAVSFAVGTPALWNLWNGGADVSAPLFTAGTTRPASMVIGGHDTGLVYTTGDGINSNQCVDEIFTPEQPAAANANDNLCLLVSGDVNIGGTTHTDRWYKLAFIRRDASGTLGYVNILRNYVYTFNITGVSDSGYPSPEAAYEAEPGNLVVDLNLNAVDESDMNSYVYNGQYYLGVTKNEYEFSCISESEQELKIYTDYPGGWEINPAPSTWPQWLKEELPWTAGATGPKNQTAAGNLWAAANVKDEAREFAFTVTAGSLSQHITVRQKPNS